MRKTGILICNMVSISSSGLCLTVVLLVNYVHAESVDAKEINEFQWGFSCCGHSHMMIIYDYDAICGRKKVPTPQAKKIVSRPGNDLLALPEEREESHPWLCGPI